MEPKKKSAIEKVVLNIYTYHNVTFSPTFINFFFGRNGAGKSAVAEAIQQNTGVQWRTGESEANYNVLVYDQNFINENFDNYEDLAGVFTLSRANIQIQKKIEELSKEKDKLAEQLSKINQELDDKKSEKQEWISESQDRVMKLTETARKKFDLAMAGKKMKKTFCPEVESKTPVWHTVEEIEELYVVAYDKHAAAYSQLKKSEDISGRYDLSRMNLLGESIVSTSDTQFARAMKKIGNTDWVKEGHAKYVKKAEGLCPFCHKELGHSFEDEIRACFDEQYQDDINAIEALQTAYDSKIKEVLRVFDANLRSNYPRADFIVYKEKLERLRTIFRSNSQLIQNKTEKPAIPVELQDIDTLIAEIDAMIEGINIQIKSNNEAVNAKKQTKINCDRILWEYLAFSVKDELEARKIKVAELDKEIKEAETKKGQLRQQYKDKESAIRAEGNHTVNTDAAFESINNMLLDSGFQGFSLRKKPGMQNRYEVVRDGNKPVSRLSEGERNFIAFLYFYHLVKGNGSVDSGIISTDGGVQNVVDTRYKIVIIDDPVSSMDSGTLFIVSSMVREMIRVCHNNMELLNPDVTGSYIKQIFILTHNAYFHREVTYNQVDFYDCVSFYMIRKTENNSSISLCAEEAKKLSETGRNINPVQNAYTALWSEYKELKSSIPLLNVIRRILEYYFMELCGYQGTGIRDIILKKNKAAFITKKPDGTIDDMDYHLAYSMLSYMDNDCSFIDGFNLIQDSAEPDQYRKVMKRIFEKMEQIRHYQMMCGE